MEEGEEVLITRGFPEIFQKPRGSTRRLALA